MRIKSFKDFESILRMFRLDNSFYSTHEFCGKTTVRFVMQHELYYHIVCQLLKLMSCVNVSYSFCKNFFIFFIDLFLLLMSYFICLCDEYFCLCKICGDYSLGLDEFKQKKLWFYVECLGFLDQRKKAKIQ